MSRLYIIRDMLSDLAVDINAKHYTDAMERLREIIALVEDELNQEAKQ